MPAPENKGKTLWEMLLERVRSHGQGNGAAIAFHNPLGHQVGSPVPMAYANGPEFTDYVFTVREIREYVRRIAGQEFYFTDYALCGVHTKSFDADKSLTARVRAIPNQAGAHDCLLLRIEDEFAFAKEFLDVLKDTTGILEITDPAGHKEIFTRINDLRDSYQAAVLVISETTPDGKALPGKTTPLKLEYWDFWREADLGGGKTAKEFLFVEMNGDTGWFQLWRGREFFS